MRIKTKVLAVSLCLLFISSIASADVVQGIDIDFVTFGDVNNPGDTRTVYPDSADPYGCGTVDYIYKVGKYEITNGQWDTFVLEAGAPIGNPSDAYDANAYWTGDNIPTNKVSWYEAAQFCNYLTSGDKSQGAYLFSGDNNDPGDFNGIDRDTALSRFETIYVIPTEDEWYKAAYYTGSGYSTYANGLNTIPAADNGWNYSGGAYDEPWDVNNGNIEQNYTFNMMGNVWEWNETPIGPDRGIRGGSFSSNYSDLISPARGFYNPNGEIYSIGFRVASVPVLLLVRTPNGGEDFIGGNLYTIEWESSSDINNVTIEYSINNGTDWNDVNTVVNTGSYEWLVPEVSSPNCLVLISDANNANDYDTSDDVFTIYICQLSSLFDTNGDCYINFKDFASFAAEWLDCGNPYDPDCGY